MKNAIYSKINLVLFIWIFASSALAFGGSTAPESHEHLLDTSHFLLHREPQDGDECSICREPLLADNSYQLNQCDPGHYFHKQCIETWFERKSKCPNCSKVYGRLIGDQPIDGTLQVRKLSTSLKGYEGKGTLELEFNFPEGVHEGTPYPKDHRYAYLPETPEGEEILTLLKQAWDQRLLFTVGFSTTRMIDNVIIFNGIHLKTTQEADKAHGWPDPHYFRNVKEELANKGVISENRSTSANLAHLQSHFPSYLGEFFAHPHPGEEADPDLFGLGWQSLSRGEADYFPTPITPSLSRGELADHVLGAVDRLSAQHNEILETRASPSSISLKEWLVAKSLTPVHTSSRPPGAVSPTLESDIKSKEFKNMIFYILQNLDQSQSEEAGISNENGVASSLKKLAAAQTRCSQEQHDSVAHLYRRTIRAPELIQEVAQVIDELKLQWLYQAMKLLSDSPTIPKRVKAFALAIGDRFHIPETEEVRALSEAEPPVDAERAKRAFLAAARVEQIISRVQDHFNGKGRGPQTREETLEFLIQNGFITPVRKNLAQALVQRQERILLEQLFPTTGYSTWAEYEEALNRVPELATQKALLDESNVKLAVFTPVKARANIIREGIKNIHQTRTTVGGSSDLLYRSAVERSQLNLSEDEYHRLPEATRPHFGVVGNKKIHTLSQYGDDFFSVDLNSLQDRLAIGITSSSNRHRDKAEKRKISFSSGQSTLPLQNWDDPYIPWKLRNLLVPFLVEDAEIPSFPVSAEISPHPSFQGTLGSIPGNQIALEFQVFGDILPALFKRFSFTETPPTPKTLRYLAEKGIPTFDLRDGAKPYQTFFYEFDTHGNCDHFKFDTNLIELVEKNVDRNLCIQSTAEQKISFYSENVKSNLNEEELREFYATNPTLGQIIDLADISGKIQVRDYAYQHGYVKTPEEAIQLWSNTVAHYTSDDIQKFFSLNPKPTFKQVFEFAPLASNHDDIRNYALKNGFVASAQEVIALYSNLGKIRGFSSWALEKFFALKPTFEQILEFAGIFEDPMKIRDYAYDNGHVQSAREAVLLFSKLNQRDFSEDQVKRFLAFEPKPTLQEVIDFANFDKNQFKIRNAAYYSGFVKSADEIIRFYSGFGEVTFTEALIDSFVSSQPSLKQMVSFMKITKNKQMLREKNAKTFNPPRPPHLWGSLHDFDLSASRPLGRNGGSRTALLEFAQRNCQSIGARLPTPEEFEEIDDVTGREHSFYKMPGYYLTSVPGKSFNGITRKVEDIHPDVESVYFNCIRTHASPGI